MSWLSRSYFISPQFWSSLFSAVIIQQQEKGVGCCEAAVIFCLLFFFFLLETVYSWNIPELNHLEYLTMFFPFYRISSIIRHTVPHQKELWCFPSMDFFFLNRHCSPVSFLSLNICVHQIPFTLFSHPFDSYYHFACSSMLHFHGQAKKFS